jgi:hypothetical protein
MSKNIWLPFWINLALLMCAVPTVSLLPEPLSNKITSMVGAEPGNESAAEAGPLLEGRDGSPARYSEAFQTRPGVLLAMLDTLRRLARLVTGRRNFQVLLCSFFLTALASSDTKLLVQYISKRYSWTFAEAGYMLSAKAIVNFTLLAVVVPRIIKASMSSKAVHGSEVRVNYLGTEISILVSVVGVLCIALASRFWMLFAGEHFWQSRSSCKLTIAALIIYALGSALPVFTMSLVKSPLIALTKPDIQDFSIVMLTKTLGSLVGAPLMTVLWVQAIELGGAGLGLPYFVSAVSCNPTLMVLAHCYVVYIRIGCSRCGPLEDLIKREHYMLVSNHEVPSF